MKQSVNSLLAKHSSLQQLLSAGFLYLDELEDVTPVELSKETKLSLEESLHIIEEVRKQNRNNIQTELSSPELKSTDAILPTNKTVSQSVSSLELFWREQEHTGITTGSKELDEMLGEGVPLGKMTEICGVPGIGKSQLAFQLCINSCLDRAAGAVLIDTEGSFVVQRAKQIADAVCVENTSTRDIRGVDLSIMTSQSILSRIHYFRCQDVVQLVCVVNTLDEFISEKRSEGNLIKLVVIDSIAFPFRMELQDMRVRSRILHTLSQTLMELTQKYGIGIVLTNQMTSRQSGKEPVGRMHQVPALGETWAHIPTIRLILQWSGPVRTARLTKSPTHMEKVVSYEITERGVSDLIGKIGSKRGLESSEHTSDTKKFKQNK
ncbi:DNA repair protein RAD51-like protein 3-like isoform X1 [Oopsacas minuta]|uniref:DNA repair protein RAD51 homolog 3 n=1 Tax=Oopsacas minuta TaxID=111878 RepID=A0AAV7JJF3_9METZ|nr:DNA repair protein RAD51-like protein 3-like isoform X1 [Oopsacas minuta]